MFLAEPPARPVRRADLYCGARVTLSLPVLGESLSISVLSLDITRTLILCAKNEHLVCVYSVCVCVTVSVTTREREKHTESLWRVRVQRAALEPYAVRHGFAGWRRDDR